MDQPIPAIPLRDGNAMPQLGFGTWQIATADCPAVVGAALAAGYRSIDTAQSFGNEDGVGRAIADSGLPRPDLFVSSKLRSGAHSRDLALRAFDRTMRDLGLEHLDLFVIHWPMPAEDRYVEAWQTLIALKEQGRVRSIGVANFERDHIERLVKETGVSPVINQIEIHPRFQQRDMRGFHARREIRLQSVSPLGPGTASASWWWTYGRINQGSLFDDPVVRGLAEKHGKTPAQIIIRWHLQDGVMLAPKTSQPDRIVASLDVFNFRLDAEDMYRIEALDLPEGRIGVPPKEWNTIA